MAVSRQIGVLLLLLCWHLTTLSGRAALASDNASDAAYNGGWTSGTDGGTGFGAWTLTPVGNSGTSGFYTGNSANNGTGGNSGNINTAGESWGMYANSGSLATAVRSLDTALSVGQTFKISMDNGNIDTGASVGFGLRNGNNNRFEFYFTGGGANYSINDASSGSRNTGIPFTDDGLRLEFTLTAANTYSLLVTPNVGTPATITGTLLSSGDINSLRLFNANAGSGSSRDLFFNSLEVVPEPANVALGIFGGLFLLVGAVRYIAQRRQARAP